VAKPAEKKDPKCAGDHEIEQRGNDSSLNQLSQPGNEETHERGNEIV